MTGLSIKTLSEALVWSEWRYESKSNSLPDIYGDALSGYCMAAHRDELKRLGAKTDKIWAALRAKSERMDVLERVVKAVDCACPEFWHNAADRLRNEGDWPEAANHIDDMADALAAPDKGGRS